MKQPLEEAVVLLELTPDGQLGSCEGIPDGLLRDVQERGDLSLLEVLLVVQVNHLLLALGENVHVIEKRVDHEAATVESSQIFVVDTASFHAGKLNLKVAADFAARPSERTVVTHGTLSKGAAPDGPAPANDGRAKDFVTALTCVRLGTFRKVPTAIQ